MPAYQAKERTPLRVINVPAEDLPVLPEHLKPVFEDGTVPIIPHKLDQEAIHHTKYPDLGPLKPTVVFAFERYAPALEYDEILPLVPQDYPHDTDYSTGYIPESHQEVKQLKTLHARVRAESIMKAFHKAIETHPLEVLELIQKEQRTLDAE